MDGEAMQTLRVSIHERIFDGEKYDDRIIMKYQSRIFWYAGDGTWIASLPLA
jgi:hypothetical protein